MEIETPSRIWRRIEEGEARNVEMPSLPSLPGYDDSEAVETRSMSLSMSHMSPKSSIGTKYRGGKRYKDVDEPLQETYSKQAEEESDLHSTGKTSNKSSMTTTWMDKVEVQNAKSFHSRQIPSSDDEQDIPLTEVMNSLSSDRQDISEDVFRHISLKSASRSYNERPSQETYDKDDADPYVKRDITPPSLSHSVSSLPSSQSGIAHSEQSSYDHFSLNYSHHDFPQASEPLTTDMNTPHDGIQALSSSTNTESDTHNLNSAQDGDTGARDHYMPNSELEVSQSQITVTADPSTPTQTAEYPTNYNGPNPQSVGIDLSTPLPRRRSFLLSVINSSSRPRLSPSTPQPSLPQQPRLLNAGFTPGPGKATSLLQRRSRQSHPLSQVHNFDTSTSSEASSSAIDQAVSAGPSTSFVSTASSHDLTLHIRANASFDPITGSQGVGRFNAGKLNTYLHSLNRRLQEENEALVAKLKSQQEELDMLSETLQGRAHLSLVAEETEERYSEEKDAFEEQLQVLKTALVTKENELKDERAERMRDKERWKDRMAEVERGVGDIVRGLEQKLEDAETDAGLLRKQMQDVKRELDKSQAEQELLRQRLEEAQQTYAEKERLTLELRKANDEKDQLDKNFYTSERKIVDLNERLSYEEKRYSDLERHSSSLKQRAEELDQKLRAKSSLESPRTYPANLEEHNFVPRLGATDRKKKLEEECSELKEKLLDKEMTITLMHSQMATATDESIKLKEAIRCLEDALEERDRQIASYVQELGLLKAKSITTEGEKSRTTSIVYNGFNSAVLTGVEAAVLQDELQEANREIGRLKSLVDQSPARKAIEKAKEIRIETLEAENKNLLGQLREAYEQRESGFVAQSFANLSMKSPIHNKYLANVSVRTPRTPGVPLGDMSWLLNATGDVSTGCLLAEIHRLQKELDLANESIDDKLDKLEEAGLGVGGLTNALEDAQTRILHLEHQLSEMKTREAHQHDSRNNSDLQSRLSTALSELHELRRQQDQKLVASSEEKAAMQDAAQRLNAEIAHARKELKMALEKGQIVEKTKAELQLELTQAKRTITDLEYHFQSEKTELRRISSEHTKALKEREKIAEKLKETEQAMEQTKEQLIQLKTAVLNTRDEQNSIENHRDTIDKLRQERSNLVEKHLGLQQTLADASKRASDLSTKYNNLQNSYDGRLFQLELQSKEIDELRRILSSQTEQLTGVQNEKRRLETECTDVHGIVMKLESELGRIQKEAEQFGRDLKQLTRQKHESDSRHQREVDHYTRTSKQDKVQIQLLKQQLEARPQNVASEPSAVAALKLQHKQECKGLIVQIHYLKAKYEREAYLRDSLVYQKQYLLVHLSRLEKSENRILAVIASHPPFSASPNSTRRSRSLKTFAILVLFIFRARQASELWQKQKSTKAMIVDALEQVRKKRANAPQ